MKLPLDDSAENKQDLLLFDYLEGNLPDALKVELEEKLALDPDLQAEMDCWKDAFFEEEFYGTEKLETTLLELNDPVKSWYSHASLNVFLLLLVTGMFSFLSLNQQEEAYLNSISITLPAPEKAETLKTIAARPATQPVNIKTNPADIWAKPISKVSPSAPMQAPASAAERNGMMEWPALNTLLPETAISQGLGTIPPESINKLKVKNTSSRSISRKEARRISRMRDKAIRERQAREFMKGRRAYVVPLNTTNF